MSTRELRDASPLPIRPSYQYGLRTLLLIVTLAAVFFSMACSHGVVLAIGATLGVCLVLSAVRKHRGGRAVFGVVVLGVTFLLTQVEQYVTEEPQWADVVGRYALASQTVSAGGLAVLEGRPCTIELRADGTFCATNVPGERDFPGPDFFDTLVTVSGTWRVEVVAHGFSFQTFWGARFDSEGAEVPSALLIGRKPPFGLELTLVEGHSMIFKRVE